jgi:tripartite-type tricarboxylate transporter receptor subunit TctC
VFCPANASSGTDAIGQVITAFWSKTLGINALMNSTNAGGGLVNYERVRNGPKDGSALLFNTVQIFLAHKIGLYTFDPWEEYTFVYDLKIYNDQLSVVVRSDSKYKTLQDLIDDAKARPNMVSCPSGPRGNTVHFRAVGFERDTGADFRLVDASGDSERITSLLGKVTDFALLPPIFVDQYVKNGDIRVLSYVANERCPFMPDVPCNGELGYPVSMPDTTGHNIFMGPKGLDEETINAIVDSLKALCEDEASREMLYRLENGYPQWRSREESYAELKRMDDYFRNFDY